MKNIPIRGFQLLIGETIKKVDATAINIVTVLCESGKVVEIDADEQHYQIGIVRCTEKKKEN
jgi:hypothetical protein